MPAHIKLHLQIIKFLSIKSQKLLLGTWQGIYLFEHRLTQQVEPQTIIFWYSLKIIYMIMPTVNCCSCFHNLNFPFHNFFTVDMSSKVFPSFYFNYVNIS